MYALYVYRLNTHIILVVIRVNDTFVITLSNINDPLIKRRRKAHCLFAAK